MKFNKVGQCIKPSGQTVGRPAVLLRSQLALLKINLKGRRQYYPLAAKTHTQIINFLLFQIYHSWATALNSFQMQLLKAQNSFEKESSIEKEREREREKRSVSRSKEEDKPSRTKEDNKFSTKDDVNFLMQVRNLMKTL